MRNAYYCIRLSKSMFMELLGMIQDSISHDTKRNMSLSPVLQLLIALRYYATGAFQARKNIQLIFMHN